MGLNLTNHFSLTSSSTVAQICADPLSGVGITYFNYIKIYNDGSRELLTNNAEWIDHFYKHALYNTSAVIDIEYLLPKGYFLWAELHTQDAAYLDGRQFYNIDNGVTLVTRCKEYTELYIFASTRENEQIKSFYQKNIDLLQRFVLFFNDKGNDLLRKASKNKIFLPDKQVVSHEKNIEAGLIEIKKKEFLASTNISRFFIKAKGGVYLTKREAECAAFTAHGATAKQIAKILKISFRTVETHLNQSKEKLNCTSKDDLIQVIQENNMHNIILMD